MDKQMKKILLVAGAALALAGCGEKGDFEKAINDKIGQDKYCFSLDNNNTSFPIRYFSIEQTPPPTSEELRALREIDPMDYRSIEFR